MKGGLDAHARRRDGMATLKLCLCTLLLSGVCFLSFMIGRMGAGRQRCPSYNHLAFNLSLSTNATPCAAAVALPNQNQPPSSTGGVGSLQSVGQERLQSTMQKQESPARILLLTAMTVDKIETYQQVTNSKQCYALKQGYTFILETNSEMSKKINPWWFKVYALQKYLAFFDWVVWLDGDCLIANPDIKFEWFLDDPHADLVLTDHNFAVNNGVFALRNTAWSEEFLDKWLGAGGIRVFLCLCAGQMVHAVW